MFLRQKSRKPCRQYSRWTQNNTPRKNMRHLLYFFHSAWITTHGGFLKTITNNKWGKTINKNKKPRRADLVRVHVTHCFITDLKIVFRSMCIIYFDWSQKEQNLLTKNLKMSNIDYVLINHIFWRIYFFAFFSFFFCSFAIIRAPEGSLRDASSI